MTLSTLHARMTFSFKGETHDIESTFDLDQCQGDAGASPNFHQMLAKAGGIDTYSYLYEVMEAHEIEFSNATGSAAQCCVDGRFDWAQFEQLRREAFDLQAVIRIAEQYLEVTDLVRQPALKSALLAAYRAGKSERQNIPE